MRVFTVTMHAATRRPLALPRSLGAARAALVYVLALIAPAAAHAQSGKPDFSGIWMQDRGSWVVDQLPFTPKGAAKHASKQAPNAIEACTVHYFGQIITGPLPVEILQSDQRVTLLYENDHEVRRVFMDGRGHPKDLYPTVMGHSIGHWDGDTLVIETAGLREGWFRPEGVPYTEQTRVVERLTLDPKGDKIHVAMTLEDPEYYSKPVEVTRTLTRMPDGEILEDLCVVSDYLYSEKPP
jgi:hypothetical protein